MIWASVKRVFFIGISSVILPRKFYFRIPLRSGGLPREANGQRLHRGVQRAKLRSECLNAHWFMSLADAREKLDAWRRDYNEVRPHSAIGYNVPIAMHYPDGAASPPS